MTETQQDILTDIVTSSELVQASGGKRFANLLIDYVVFIILIFCMEVVWYLISPKTLTGAADNGMSGLWLNLAGFVLYAVYYTVIELVTKGSSIGKLITGTKAINEDGTNITVGTAVKRSLSRLVPFEIFSAFGTPSYPWHDSWTRTYVIDIKKSKNLSGQLYDNYNNITVSL